MAEFSLTTQFAIHCAVDIIRNSRKGAVLSGAGISTPSGIPDFRSANSGLWEQVNPLEVASQLSFRYQPETFFNWMRPFAERISRAQPNAAHTGLARLEQSGYIQTVITQNIDSLHQRAGSRNVLEVHGHLRTMTCLGCYQKYEAGSFVTPYLEEGILPRCPHCRRLLKPDLILLGEQLPAEVWLNAQQASRQCDLMIVVGSSLEVLPVAGLPMRALENGAHLIIINKTHTYLDVRADVVFHEDLAEIIPAIVEAVLDG